MTTERHSHAFSYDPGTPVIILDEIHGVIIGQQHVCGDEDRYLVEYVTAGGEPIEKWWRETALDPSDDDPGDAEVIKFTDNVVPIRQVS